MEGAFCIPLLTEDGLCGLIAAVRVRLVCNLDENKRPNDDQLGERVRAARTSAG